MKYMTGIIWSAMVLSVAVFIMSGCVPDDLDSEKKIPSGGSEASDSAPDDDEHDTDSVSETSFELRDTADSTFVETADTEISSEEDTSMEDTSISQSDDVCVGCLIDGICYEEAAVNPQNICEYCVSARSVSEWTANEGASCDDGEFCNGESRCAGDGRCVAGTPVSCESAWTCALAACDEENDICSYTVQAGACLINNICYNAGDVNPMNSCEVCRPTESQEEWSGMDAGTSCGYCLACNGDGACTQSPTCCATAESDIHNGFCATGPQMFVGNGCGYQWDWFRRSFGSYAYGVDAYICNQGVWEKDGTLSAVYGVECEDCVSPLYEEQWSTHSCSIEIGTEEVSCNEALEWK
ncbi:MAG: hypothetical protein JXX29_01830 [Deltaproteobacteria bacterium]|nr:hypothetical protein [Deltaproteobacteria bacterium]MBN2670380.1 hypothetical protein [Deltaproteobacteria bacterium]